MILGLLQARVSSTRLPGKVILPLLGKPMILRQLERLRRVRQIDKLVLATSNDPSDDPLAALCTKESIECFRGSLDDVLDRFYQAARAHQPDYVVRLTGDCPLADPEIIDDLISYFLDMGGDYASNCLEPTFPDGLDAEIVRFSCLETAWKEATLPSQREHVTPFIHQQPGRFRIGCTKSNTDLSELRWTVDEPVDFELVTRIYEALYPQNPDFSTSDILTLLELNPRLRSMNVGIMRNEGYRNSLRKDAAEINVTEKRMNTITNFDKSRDFSDHIHNLVPGGAHTYSKGDDQFPLNAPAAITHGKGAHVWDLDGNEYVDCSMGLTSVSIGHGFEAVAKAVCEAAYSGTNFQRPAALEMKAAQTFLATVQSGDMVKFAKNGSTVTTAAVKLARAYTGRNRIALCREHNFFSYDDWFIVTTPCDRGIPEATRGLTAGFSYNDIASVEALFADSKHDIACLIMEPVKFDPPKDNFLQKVADLCKKHGVVYIIDEMISGFKWGMKGAQNYFGVTPDLSTWGKGIANGFSCCALTGRADIMELGGIRHEGDDKLFLISTTHGAETIGLAAMIATIENFTQHNMIECNWARGAALKQRLEQIIQKHALESILQVVGYPCLLVLVCRNQEGVPDDSFRTLMMQEMIARGVLFQGMIYPTWSHQQLEMDIIAAAFDESCGIYRQAVEAGSTDGLLIGRPAKAVFRKKI